MKLGSCIHLEELRSAVCSILSLDLFFHGSLTFIVFLCFGHFLRNYKGKSHEIGSCIHLEEIMSTLPSIFSLDLLLTVH